MFQAKIVSIGDDKYRATTRHASFDMASDGTSSKPVDALLASLCACLGHYVGDYLREQKIKFSDYTVSAESDLTADASRLAEIRVFIEVSKARLNEATRTAMLKYITQCYIYGTLKSNSAIHLCLAGS